jgi:hypothetical protein
VGRGEAGGRGAKSTVVIRNFNLGMSKVKKREEIGLTQSLIYIHPFLPLSPKFFYIFPSSTRWPKNIVR